MQSPAIQLLAAVGIRPDHTRGRALVGQLGTSLEGCVTVAVAQDVGVGVHRGRHLVTSKSSWKLNPAGYD